HNKGGQPMTGLRIVAKVGHHATTGEPLRTRVVSVLDPGATRTVRIPVVLSAPAWGDYIVSGTVYGTVPPVRFSEKTSNDASALVLLIPIALLVYAQVLRRRERARKRQQEAEARQAAMWAYAARQAFAQISPEVGVGDGDRYKASFYDPTRNGT